MNRNRLKRKEGYKLNAILSTDGMNSAKLSNRLAVLRNLSFVLY